jgi:hypothetical protein
MDTDICAAAAALTADSADSRVMRLQLWLDENGASIRSLKVAEVDGLRGVFASGPVVEGELIIHVPRKLILTADVAKASWSGQVIAAMGGRPSDYGYMAAFLLETRRESGFWKPYVDTLPISMEHMPALFSDEERQYLRGSYIERSLKSQREWLDWDCRQYNEAMPRSLQVSREEFAWARCAVLSRVYGATLDGHRTVAMVPLADMFNHSPRPNAGWTSDMTQGFVVTARRPIGANDVVHESYGIRCNATLYIVYGFVLDHNDSSRAEVLLPQLPQDHPLHERVKNLGLVVDELRGFELPTRYDNDKLQPLFTRLRLGALDSAADAPAASAKPEGAPDNAAIEVIPPLSRANEARALDALMEACRQSLARFATTIEEDDALLAAGTLPAKLRGAVWVCRGEKLILQRWLALAQQAVEQLRDPARALSLPEGADALLAGYFEQLVKHLPPTA